MVKKMPKKISTTLGVILLLFSGSMICKPAHASSVVALDLQQLVGRADEVAIGKAVSSRSRWNERGKIVTDTTFRIEEGFKGSCRPGELVTITSFGGVIGDIGMKVPGAAEFKIGEKFLVFAESMADSAGGLRFRPITMSQGVMALKSTARETHVLPGSQGLVLMKQDGHGKMSEAKSWTRKPIRLEEMKQRIRFHVRASRVR